MYGSLQMSSWSVNRGMLAMVCPVKLTTIPEKHIYFVSLMGIPGAFNPGRGPLVLADALTRNGEHFLVTQIFCHLHIPWQQVNEWIFHSIILKRFWKRLNIIITLQMKAERCYILNEHVLVVLLSLGQALVCIDVILLQVGWVNYFLISYAIEMKLRGYDLYEV